MAEHDPTTCKLCHDEGMAAEIAFVEKERDRYRCTLEGLREIAALHTSSNSMGLSARMVEEMATAALEGSEATP